MTVSKRLRFEILRRDNHTCRYCGGSAPDVDLTVDHVTPVALGGSDDASNLVSACKDCNAGKAASSPDATLVADVDNDAVRWAAALKRAGELERAERDKNVEVRIAVYEHWTMHNNQWAWPPQGWEVSVDRFIASGLTLDDILDAADTAMDTYGVTQRNRWRYFCGVCWKVIERRQEAARAILAAEDGTPDGS